MLAICWDPNYAGIPTYSQHLLKWFVRRPDDGHVMTETCSLTHDKIWCVWCKLFYHFNIAAAVFSVDCSCETYKKHICCFHLLFRTAYSSGAIALPVKFHLHSQYVVFLFLFVRFHTVQKMMTVTGGPMGVITFTAIIHTFFTPIFASGSYV